MPQDVEWTYEGESLVLLQSRPITTLRSGNSEDERGWYLSLHRSFDNLKNLRRKIEDELIPGMIAVAERLSAIDPAGLPDEDLAAEIRKRWEINHKWVNIYWADFIPYAHGVRMFGQVYNDAVQPDDPYEFIDLLTNTDMASIARNNRLMDLAAMVRSDPHLVEKLKQGDDANIDVEFRSKIDEFIEKFGDLSCAVTGGRNCVLGTDPLFQLLLEMANHPAPTGSRQKNDRLSEKANPQSDKSPNRREPSRGTQGHERQKGGDNQCQSNDRCTFPTQKRVPKDRPAGAAFKRVSGVGSFGHTYT